MGKLPYAEYVDSSKQLFKYPASQFIIFVGGVIINNIRIGILCPSEIAFRRFMPALQKTANMQYVGVALASSNEWSTSTTPSESLLASEKEKANRFCEQYGGSVFNSYNKLLESPDIDAVYIPLPPALHFEWAKKALECGKHVFLEKPFTTSLSDTETLIKIAKTKRLALHENYMFQYHSQLDEIKKMIAQGTIGDIRLIRIAFGFPFRGANDFRYNKSLGGGALLDCGGYTLKLASVFLGELAEVTESNLNYKDGFEVDIYGSATLKNKDGLTAQVAFGMDNSYKCELEVWGSSGTIYTNRILTSPDGYEPTVIIKTSTEENTKTFPTDDSFGKSIIVFGQCVLSEEVRLENYSKIIIQSRLLDAIN